MNLHSRNYGINYTQSIQSGREFLYEIYNNNRYTLQDYITNVYFNKIEEFNKQKSDIKFYSLESHKICIPDEVEEQQGVFESGMTLTKASRDFGYFQLDILAHAIVHDYKSGLAYEGDTDKTVENVKNVRNFLFYKLDVRPAQSIEMFREIEKPLDQTRLEIFLNKMCDGSFKSFDQKNEAKRQKVATREPGDVTIMPSGRVVIDLEQGNNLPLRVEQLENSDDSFEVVIQMEVEPERSEHVNENTGMLDEILIPDNVVFNGEPFTAPFEDQLVGDIPENDEINTQDQDRVEIRTTDNTDSTTSTKPAASSTSFFSKIANFFGGIFKGIGKIFSNIFGWIRGLLPF